MDKEYIMLREEIMENMKSMRNYMALAFTAVTAIITYISNNPNNPNMFIVVFVVLLSVSSRVRGLFEGNISISTYMEVFLEPNSNEYKWETRNHFRVGKYNIHRLESKNSFLATLLFRANSVYLLLGIFAYIMFIFVLLNNITLTNLLFSGLLNTIALLLLIYIASIDANDKRRDKYLDYWNKVKEESNR